MPALRKARGLKAEDLTLLTNLERRRPHGLLFVMVLGGLTLLVWPARALRSDNFVIYSSAGPKIVPLQAVGQTNYFPLLQLLNALGKVQGLTAGRDSIKVFFEDSQLEFHADDKKVRLGKDKINLSDPVRVVEGQWMVPVSFLETVLPRIVHEPFVYHQGSRRAYVGDVHPNAFSFRLEPLANGARLTLTFSEKVNVRTASSNGKWILYLGDKPVQPLEQKFTFQDPYLSNMQFDDQDGIPKLILTPAADGLNFYPKVDETGRVIMADMIKPAPAVTPLPPPEKPPEIPTTIVPPPSTPSTPQTVVPAGEAGTPVIALDAGHGGEDSGARGGNGVLEKDLMAQLVARVRSALINSKRYRVVLTRLGDVTLSPDQRAGAANAAHPELFITFHAGNLGVHAPRIVVFTYQPSSLASTTENARLGGLFIPWGTVQASQLPRSQEFSEALQKALVPVPGAAVFPTTAAPLRVLRGVNAPAVALEIGSLAPEVDSTPLSNTAFQDGIASAVVHAVDAFEGRH